MNRRAFSLALAAVACGGPRRTRRHRKEPDGGVVTQPTEPVILDGTSLYRYTAARAPLAFRGDVLIQNRDGELLKWDSIAMKRLANYQTAHQSFCFMQDGTLAVFALPSDHCVVYRIDGADKMRTLYGPPFSERGTILPARRADEYYVIGQGLIYRFEESNGRVEAVATVPFPNRTSNPRHLVYSLDDGRLVVAGGGMRVFSPDGPEQNAPMPGRIAKHLASAPNERCWYSYVDGSGERINTLVLARLSAPVADEQRIVFGEHEHITQIASAPGAVAVLLLWVDEEKETPQEGLRWAVVVYGEIDGKPRWRVDLPLEVTSTRGFHAFSEAGFVAISEHRVVLRAFDHRLYVWDAGTGAVVASGIG